jgi:hypothetical protein
MSAWYARVFTAPSRTRTRYQKCCGISHYTSQVMVTQDPDIGEDVHLYSWVCLLNDWGWVTAGQAWPHLHGRVLP